MSAATLRWFVLCDRREDRPDGSVTLHGVRDTLSTPAFPARVSITAVVELDAETEADAVVRFAVVGPGGVIRTPGEARLSLRPGMSFTVATELPVVVSRPGLLHVAVELDGVILARTPFEVRARHD